MLKNYLDITVADDFDFVENPEWKKVLELLKLVLIKLHHLELQLIFQ